MPEPKIERTLPHDEEAEKLALGTTLLDETKIWQLVDELEPEDFYISSHKIICRALYELADDEIPINHVSLFDKIRDSGELENIGNGKDLADIISNLRKGVPKSVDLTYYIGKISKNALARKKIKLNEKISQALIANDIQAADEAEAELYDISNRSRNAGLLHIGGSSTEILRKAYITGKSKTKLTGVPTGIYTFDYWTSGLQKTDLIIVAARPSVGKTALMMSMAQFAALNKAKVAVFSLEMSRDQLIMRMICSLARVSIQKLRTGTLTADEWARLIFAQKLIDGMSIYINDTAAISPLYLKSNAKKLKMMLGEIDLILVDYLQLMSGNKRTENRQQEVSSISRDLKAVAKELQVPVVALSQLSRAPETRSGGNKKPMLSDLRDSGAIEQDADIVSFIHREEMYSPSPENENMAELILAKQRNGPTGTIPMAFLKEFTRFENIFTA